MAIRISAAVAALGWIAAASQAAAAPYTWQLTGHVAEISVCCSSSPVPVSDPVLTSLGVYRI